MESLANPIEPTQLTEVTFYEDTLQAVQKGNEVWVSLRRCCEALNLSYGAQFDKLQKHAWACVSLIEMHDTTGRLQQLAMINLETLTGWLVGIQVGRVAAHVKPKLIRYQKEAVAVLKQHFFGGTKRSAEQGETGILALAAEMGKTIGKEIVREVKIELGQMNQKIEVVDSKVDGLVERFDDFERRFGKKRKRLSRKTKLRHIEAVGRMGGRCPCCREEEIVDASSRPMRGSEFDHFIDRSQAAVDQTWLVCGGCNENLKRFEFYKNAKPQFEAYQTKRIELEHRGYHPLLVEAAC